MFNALVSMDNRVKNMFGNAKETRESVTMLEDALSLAPTIILDIKVPTDTNFRKGVKNEIPWTC